MTVPDEVLQRIRKLYAKAEGARDLGSLEEAEAFLTKVHSLMAEYQLSLTDLQWTEVLEAQDYHAFFPAIDIKWMSVKGELPLWIMRIALGLAEAFGCTTAVVPKHKVLVIFGPNTMRPLVERLIQRIVGTAMRAAIKFADKYHQTSERSQLLRESGSKGRTGPRQSYLIGFTIALAERLDKEQAKRGSGKALARTNQSLARARQLCSENTTKDYTPPDLPQQDYVAEAFEQGQEHGETISINEGLMAAEEEATPLALPAPRD